MTHRHRPPNLVREGTLVLWQAEPYQFPDCRVGLVTRIVDMKEWCDVLWSGGSRTYVRTSLLSSGLDEYRVLVE